MRIIADCAETKFLDYLPLFIKASIIAYIVKLDYYHKI